MKKQAENALFRKKIKCLLKYQILHLAVSKYSWVSLIGELNQSIDNLIQKTYIRKIV